MKTIKWGIIGCGNVCELKSGPAFYKCDNSVLHAVMRRDAEKVANFASRHNVSRWYIDANELINDPEVDAVYIATPPSSHAQYAIKALLAGKSVYVEKPMAMNYAKCVGMINAANQSRQKLWVAYYRRALPYFIKIKEIIDSRVIGKVQTANVRFFRPPADYDLSPDTQIWRVNKAVSGGGYFYDVASHTIDILYYLLGKFIDAKGIITNTAGLYNVEDTVSASFSFDCGVVGSGIWQYAGNKLKHEDSIEITGSKGIINFSTFAFTPIELKTESGTQTYELAPPPHIQQPLIQTIVNEMLGSGKCPSTGETAAHTNWVIDKIFGIIV